MPLPQPKPNWETQNTTSLSTFYRILKYFSQPNLFDSFIFEDNIWNYYFIYLYIHATHHHHVYTLLSNYGIIIKISTICLDKEITHFVCEKSWAGFGVHIYSFIVVFVRLGNTYMKSNWCHSLGKFCYQQKFKMAARIYYSQISVNMLYTCMWYILPSILYNPCCFRNMLDLKSKIDMVKFDKYWTKVVQKQIWYHWKVEHLPWHRKKVLSWENSTNILKVHLNGTPWMCYSSILDENSILHKLHSF